MPNIELVNSLRLQRTNMKPQSHMVVVTPKRTLVVPKNRLNRLASALNEVRGGLNKHLTKEHQKLTRNLPKII